MAFRMTKVQAWSAEIPDRPGAAAATLECLAHAGADVKMVFTRNPPSRPDIGVIYLAPLIGAEQTEAAKKVGLQPARDVAMLCIEGDDRLGLGFEIMSRLAVAGINLRGLTLSTVDSHFTAYLVFDNADDVTHANQLLAGLN
jgi:hypothetical protein